MPLTPFSKYSGCGNDFILIDNRDKIFPIDNKKLVQKCCNRRFGVGADGIILLENSKNADFLMRVLNADGTEAEMCGNGLRCLGQYLKELNIPGDSFHIEVTHKIYPIKVDPSYVNVSLIPPTEIKWNVKVPLEEKIVTLDFLNTGVPHVVIFTEDLENIEFTSLGPKIRHHSLFAPRGTNVNFASLAADGSVHMRTYERGVEQETLACGTGAAAVAIAATIKYHLKSPITVNTRSGEPLEFHLAMHNGEISNLTMKGPATWIFRGKVKFS